MESVYLETTFVSYLVARPSRDLLVAAHQQITQEWWTARRDKFECFVSQVVIDEATAGDLDEARKRAAVLGSLPMLEITDTASLLTQAILAGGTLPPRAARDAAHIAVAAVNRIDYLLTWNCRHLANAQVIRRIAAVCERFAQRMPTICTPEELMGECNVMWDDPIVAEVRRVREQLAARFNFDVDAIFADLRRRQAESGRVLVCREPRPVDESAEASSIASQPPSQ